MLKELQEKLLNNTKKNNLFHMNRYVFCFNSLKKFNLVKEVEIESLENSTHFIIQYDKEIHSKEAFLAFKQLKRLVNKCGGEQLELSINTLKMGKNIIKGKMGNDTFYTPLILQDVYFEILDNHQILLIVSQDFSYNKNIITTNLLYKEKSKKIDLSNNLSLKNILEQGEFIFNNKDLEKAILNSKFSKQLLEFDKDQIIAKDNQLEFLPGIILGRFNETDTNIFSIYEEIFELDKEVQNQVLDFKSDFSQSEEEIDFKEKDILLINELDISQKIATKRALENDLIISGCAGAGKSQVITNIIANILNKNDNVVFLAEKAIATEIIFDRINEFEMFTLFYNGNTTKKQFYKQLNKTTNFIYKNINNHFEIIDIDNIKNQKQDLIDNAFLKGNIIREYLELEKKEIELTKKMIFNNKMNYIIKTLKENVALRKSFLHLNIACFKEKQKIYKIIEFHKEILRLIFPIIISDPKTFCNENLFEFKYNEFDYLIFDEASQILPENSIPNLFRAKIKIVVGDENQLRPENVKVLETNDIETNSQISLFDFAMYRYQNTNLRFHYRSEFANLFKFANETFYDNKIFLVDNPKINQKSIETINLTNAIWDRNLQVNKMEALKVVEIISNYISQGETNLGIITMNITQKDFILEKLYSVSKNNVELYKNLKNKNILVKNIDEIQGDERKIIIFSIGFAKDKDGKFINNFGKLNQIGGINRINVAITRSKTKMIVIKSFETKWLKIKNENIKVFKKFLEFCENQENNISIIQRECKNEIENNLLKQIENTFKVPGENFKKEIIQGKIKLFPNILDEKGNVVYSIALREKKEIKNCFEKYNYYLYELIFLIKKGWNLEIIFT